MLIQNALGKVTFSKDVVSNIVGKTAAATQGISAISSGFVEGITQKLAGKSHQAGIVLTPADTSFDIRLSIAVQYGIRIHVVCRELQQNIREAVERYTGLEIGCIQVDVEEITVP
jgi:uncharacterized alkaline shock family protein YloU